MATIVLRSIKGSPLTNDEVDANFINLNVELGAKLPSSTYTAADILTKIKTVDGTGSGLDADSLRGKKQYDTLPGTFSVSSVSRSTNTSTINTALPHEFLNGDTVNVYGALPISFNGTYVISSVPTTTSFTYVQNGKPDVSTASQTLAKCYKEITEATIPERDSSGIMHSPIIVAKTVYSNVTGNLTGDVTGNVSGTASNVSGVVGITNGGTGGTTQAEARTALGLGSLATQNANAVAITGGTITGLTNALAIADGGTGANNASTARTNLGLGNVTNESKATMFTNPSFTGTTTANIVTANTANIPTVNATTVSTGSVSASGTVSAASLSATGNVSASEVVNDKIGNVRKIPSNIQSSPYTLLTSDIGKSIIASDEVIVPNSTFSSGDVVTIFNNTTSNITITCNISLAYVSGTTTDRDSVALRGYGLATVFFVSPTVCVISGSVV